MTPTTVWKKMAQRDSAGRSLFFTELRKMMPGYLFILPAVLLISVFVFLPIVASLFLSFTRYNVLQPPQWVGLDNYYRLIFEDRLFWIAVRNTVLYVVGTVPVGVMISLLLAVWVDSVKIPFMKYLFRTIYFLPTITAIVAISVVWKWLYAGGNYGLINYVLMKIGISPVDWLTNPRTTLPAIMLMSIWGGVGYNFIIFLAGLQGIPRTIYEAAEIDGASGFRNFWHITLPLLRPAHCVRGPDVGDRFVSRFLTKSTF
jgi:multiple sugar transport system permease protein